MKVVAGAVASNDVVAIENVAGAAVEEDGGDDGSVDVDGVGDDG